MTAVYSESRETSLFFFNTFDSQLIWLLNGCLSKDKHFKVIIDYLHANSGPLAL